MCKSQTFTDAKGNRTYSIRHFISCSTKRVIYCAHCPCDKIYIEHVRDIDKSKTVEDPSLLNTIPRHFFEHHNSNSSLLKVKGIDIVQMGSRGRNLAKNLARLERCCVGMCCRRQEKMEVCRNELCRWMRRVIMASGQGEDEKKEATPQTTSSI
ncbi:unnamed protein product, partial [Ranitomeya imitator]